MLTALASRLPLSFSAPALEDLCRKWRMRELAAFGSVLREDFSPASDVDLLVTFEPEAGWSLWDFLDLRAELAQLLGRDVDLVSRGGLKNPTRSREILSSRRVLYAA